MRKGSITPFCALSLMLIGVFLFALLELARVYGLDCYAGMKVEAGIDSVCAEYQPFLWEQYGLLFLDGAYGTEHFSMDYVTESLENHMVANCNLESWIHENWGLDLFQIRTSEIQLEGYALATDDEGEIFLNYVAERAKENLPLGVAEDLYPQYRNVQKVEKQYSGVEASILEAKQVLEEVEFQWIVNQEKEAENVDEAEAVEETKPDTSALENILTGAGDMYRSGTLNMIFADLSGISQKNSRLPQDMESRKKKEGTMSFSGSKDWYRKLLVLDYMGDFFSNYTDKKEEHFLDYEMEYVISGKSTEWENLDGALDRIMLIRESANEAYLLQDKEKMALVDSLSGIVGLMAGENPGVIRVIQIGIIGAWAYMESVLDVRKLVSGGCIPLIKQGSEWTTELTNLFVVFDKDARAKTCERGLSYEDYLKQILFMLKKSKLAYRMMEVMEIGMRQIDDFENCRMNQMIVALRYKLQLQSEPLFSVLISIGEAYDGSYSFSKEVERSYIP